MRLPQLTKTQQKIAIGAAGGIGLITVIYLATRSKKGSTGEKKLPTPPPRPKGLHFNTRNLDALNAVVDALVADPKINVTGLTFYANQLANYGLTEQEAKLRAKAAIAPKYTAQQIESGITQLWEQQAKQGFW